MWKEVRKAMKEKGAAEIEGKKEDLSLEDCRIVLNVGGQKHETRASTLERIPGSRLAQLAIDRQSDESWDPETKEYYFDRNPRAFECVLHYYRMEELHIDQSLCGNVLKAEFEHWGIDELDIEACCWADYSKYTENREALETLDDNFAPQDAFVTDTKDKTKWQSFKEAVWIFLEDPTSSKAAKVYAITSMVFVVISVTIFVLETHKLFQVDANTGRPMSEVDPDKDEFYTRCCCAQMETDINSTNTTSKFTPKSHPVIDYIDYLCVAFFALEIITRFTFAPHKCKFWKQALNIIDLVCIIPHISAIILKSADENSASSILKSTMMLRVIRVLRIFKLMKHYSAFKILVYTIKVSSKELLLMIVFLMSGTLMFASVIHYAEKENFPNIPMGIWWALVTMTTVGYGDKYPKGYIGYGIGCLCVLCGVLVIAFTVPIVVNNFSLYYSHALTRINKLPNNKKDKRHRHGPDSPCSSRCPSVIDLNDPTSRVNPSAPAYSLQQLNVKSLVHKDFIMRTGSSSKVRGSITPIQSVSIHQYEEQSQMMVRDAASKDIQVSNEKRRQEMLVKMKLNERASRAQQHNDQ